MTRRFLPRHRLTANGWAHPYGHGPFSPYLYADGGDGDGSASAAGEPPAPAASATPAPAPAAANTGTDDGSDLTATVKRLEKDLADARKEAGKERATAKQQAADAAVADLTAKLGKALGLVKDDGPPDPKALAEAISQKDQALAKLEAALRVKDVELAVRGRSEKLGAKAGALLNSRSFYASLAELDPAAKGFETALDGLIKAELKDNPSYAVTAAAAASGSDLSGGTGEGSARQRPTSLSAAVRGSFGT